MSQIEEYWIEPFVPTSGNGFIDVGANLCMWSKWLSPGYKFIHAVEPYQEAINAAGELPSNVTVHLCGAWSKEDRIPFGIYGPSKLLFAQRGIESYFADIGTNPPEGPASLILPCRTLDSMVPEKDEISLIKVDVEGSEVQTMIGAKEIIKRSRPFMIVEIHSKKNVPPIEEMLYKENYSIKSVRNPGYNEHIHHPHWSNHFWLICNPETRP